MVPSLTGTFSEPLKKPLTKPDQIPVGVTRHLCVVPDIPEPVKSEVKVRQVGGAPSHIYPGIINYSSQNIITKISNYTEGTRVNTIQGPDDKIMDLIQSSQKKTAAARDDRLEKRKKRLEEEPDDGRYILPATQKRLAREEKDPMAYTSTDLQYAFRECWKTAGFNGQPFPWTFVEKSKMKDLIKAQNPKVALEYIQYVFANWDSIQKRYKLNGYPNVAMIYGYRRTWVAEMQNGIKNAPLSGPLEYDPNTAASKAATVGWLNNGVLTPQEPSGSGALEYDAAKRSPKMGPGW